MLPFWILTEGECFTNSTLLNSEKYNLKEWEKYIISSCRQVIIVKISVILSSTMRLYLRVLFSYLYIYKVVNKEIFLLRNFSCPKEIIEIFKNT